MPKFICFLGLILISLPGISQKARYIKCIDAETGEVLRDVTLTAMNTSKALIKYEGDLIHLAKHKKKNQYYLSADDFETRGLSSLEIPKKKDTSIVLMLPSTDLMDKRWKVYMSDSVQGLIEKSELTLNNTKELEALLVNQLLISRAAMIHCESLCAAGSTFSFLVEFTIDDGGFLEYKEVQYARNDVKCEYIFRELRRTVLELPHIKILEAIDGRKLGRQRLMLPVTIGL